MEPASKPRKTRKPRIGPEVRTRIIQLRGSNEDQPLSLDAILDELAIEEYILPSRGTVQNIVRAWEDMPPDIRQRDLPFEWHLLERARLPWEASRWVLDCLHAYHVYAIGTARRMELNPEPFKEYPPVDRFLANRPPFTNRWATWCWRIHQAVPERPPSGVLLIAGTYSLAEQAEDLLPNHPSMKVAAYDSWLAFRPYLAESVYWTEEIQGDDAMEYADVYQEAKRFGIAPLIPENDEEHEQAKRMERLPQSSRLHQASAMGMAKGRDDQLLAYFELWRNWDKAKQEKE